MSQSAPNVGAIVIKKIQSETGGSQDKKNKKKKRSAANRIRRG